jgi:hypothetical protein
VVNASLDEIVLFELPTRWWAERLLSYVAPCHRAWMQMQGDDEATVVGVLLNPDEDDVARLLRAVHRWVARSGIAALCFELDGRAYVLEAREASLAPS